MAFCLFFVNASGNTCSANTVKKEHATFTQHIETTHLSGVDLWIAVMYNGNRVLYAVVVTLVMAVLGTTLAFFTDLVLKALGMEVSRLSHRE